MENGRPSQLGPVGGSTVVTAATSTGQDKVLARAPAPGPAQPQPGRHGMLALRDHHLYFVFGFVASFLFFRNTIDFSEYKYLVAV